MAEFLIKLEPHWYDVDAGYEKAALRFDAMLIKSVPLTAEQKIRNKEKLALKFAARHRIGDIVDARPAGFKWGDREGLPKFGIVSVPGLAFNDAQKLKGSWTENDGVQTICKRKCRFRLDETKVSPLVWNKLKKDGRAEIKKADFLLSIFDHQKETYYGD